MARVYKRGRTWYSDAFIPSHPQADKEGRVRIPLSTDQRIAITRLDDLISLGDAAKHGHAPADISFEEWRKKFLSWAESKKRSTRAHDRQSVDALEKFCFPQKLSDVTPEKLETLQAALKKAGKINSRINRHMMSLKAMMRKAEDWGYIKPQKWATVKALPQPKGKLVFYTPDEFFSLLQACKGLWKTLVILGGRAGLRLGEIYWLDWQSVDFVLNRLHIAPRYDEKKVLLWSPKDHERRWVTMASDLRGYLQKLPRHGRWVFSDKGGIRPASEERVTIEFFHLSRRLGFNKGTIHILRHTFAAHLISSGKVTLRELQLLLGHATQEQTEVYAHLMPERLESAVSHLPAPPWQPGTIVP